jgi:hypothetical protein
MAGCWEIFDNCFSLFAVIKLLFAVIIRKHPIFAAVGWEIRSFPIGFWRKSCFLSRKTIFAKKFEQTFLQGPPQFPHGEMGS